MTPTQIRRLINLQFAKNKKLTDPRVIDMLVVQGEMELEETVNQWKMKPHVMQLLGTSEVMSERPVPADLPDAIGRQAWMHDLIMAAEAAAGTSHDAKRAERLTNAAAERFRGSRIAPGTQVSPALAPGLQDLWEDASTKGRTRIADKVMTGQAPAEGRAFYSRERPIKMAPVLLQQIRDDAAAGVMSAETEKMTAVAWKERQLLAAAGEAEMPFNALPSDRSRALLPPWVATRTRSPRAPGQSMSPEHVQLLRNNEAEAAGVVLPANTKDAADNWADSCVDEFSEMQAKAAQVYDMFAQRRTAVLHDRA